MTIIDAHSHLWLRQDAVVDGQPIRSLPNGRALFFGEERQMLPPFLIDGRNSAEVQERRHIPIHRFIFGRRCGAFPFRNMQGNFFQILNFFLG